MHSFMSRRNSAGQFILSAFIFVFSSFGFASSVVVDLDRPSLPSVDLVYNGFPLDPDKAVDLSKSGLDLSLLDPQETDSWQNQSYDTNDLEKWNYPKESSILTFHSVMIANPQHWFRAQLVQGDQMFRLNMGLGIHQALIRAALLRKIGYPVQSPQHYQKLTIKFSSENEKKNFIDQLALRLPTVPPEEWQATKSDDSLMISLKDVLLEPATMSVSTSLYMGVINETHLRRRRTMRALIVPFVLVDLPENINMFSWEPASLFGRGVVLTHLHADQFGSASVDDCQWILRRIAQLSRNEWRQIVLEAQYPSDIAAVVVEKIIARRNKLISLFDLKGSTQLDPIEYDPKITSGFVVEGKVIKQNYPNHVDHFTNPDPKSPLEFNEILKFLEIEGISIGIKEALGILNEKLEFLSMSDLQEKRIESLKKNLFEHFKKNPFQPYSQPISTWHGPLAGLIFQASRHVVTGSYFGDSSTDFRVSLVDQVSAGARIGYFLGVDGVPKVFPGIGANLFVQRSFAHIQPISSLSAAEKESWKKLYVPGHMKDLAALLSPEMNGETPEDNLKKMKESLELFISRLKDNETLTITDSITMAENASLSIPLSVLMSGAPLAFINNVVLGQEASRVILNRTTFTKENGKIKIYLQNAHTFSMGPTLDVNWWMSIFQVSHLQKWGDGNTRAYHLDEKPKDEDDVRNSIIAIANVLRENNPTYLSEHFNPFHLKHETESEILNQKLLYYRRSNIKESHKVKIRLPQPEDKSWNPDQFERTLFSFRQLSRSGHNYHSFLSDVLDGLTQDSSFFRAGIFDPPANSNPRDSFMGNAKWSDIRTEIELTEGRSPDPVTVAENYWAGWTLTKDELFRIIDEIDDQIRSLDLKLPIIDKDKFNEMQNLQLYEIRTTLVIYEKGLINLRNAILQNTPRPGRGLRPLFGWDQWSHSDPNILHSVIIPLIGGQKEYHSECIKEFNKNLGQEYQSDGGSGVLFHGQHYSCLPGWMRKILELRRSSTHESELEATWNNQLITLLQGHTKLGLLMNLIGKDNFYYQVKISGFKTNDSNGDTADYTSSGIGTFDPERGSGIFRKIANDPNVDITWSELTASYLTEGY